MTTTCLSPQRSDDRQLADRKKLLTKTRFSTFAVQCREETRTFSFGVLSSVETNELVSAGTGSEISRPVGKACNFKTNASGYIPAVNNAGKRDKGSD